MKEPEEDQPTIDPLYLLDRAQWYIWARNPRFRQHCDLQPVPLRQARRNEVAFYDARRGRGQRNNFFLPEVAHRLGHRIGRRDGLKHRRKRRDVGLGVGIIAQDVDSRAPVLSAEGEIDSDSQPFEP